MKAEGIAYNDRNPDQLTHLVEEIKAGHNLAFAVLQFDPPMDFAKSRNGWSEPNVEVTGSLPGGGSGKQEKASSHE
jgi:hypothetical protein